MKQQSLIPIFIALLAAAGITGITIYALKDYGFTLFLIVPFLLGLIPTYLHPKRYDLTGRQSRRLGLATLGIALVLLLVFALEGIICIAMSLPLLVPMNILGSYLAHKQTNKAPNNKAFSLIVVLLGSVGLSFDTIHSSKDDIHEATTTVTIEAPIEEVWKQVVTFEELEEPDELLFKTGVAYPINATIKGEGVGAIRYCNFTTGPFVEPITTWDEPNLLAFDVTAYPIPMNEFNPFWDIHPPHLDGYFASEKGQFKLTCLGPNKTKLEGTTWFKVDIDPAFYWAAWSEYIIHEIHNRVLTHIKIQAEL